MQLCLKFDLAWQMRLGRVTVGNIFYPATYRHYAGQIFFGFIEFVFLS